VSRPRGGRQLGVSANSGKDCWKALVGLRVGMTCSFRMRIAVGCWQMLVNSDAYLHLYPDPGHGFLSEYHQHFAAMVNTFLDEPEREEEDWD